MGDLRAQRNSIPFLLPLFMKEKLTIPNIFHSDNQNPNLSRGAAATDMICLMMREIDENMMMRMMMMAWV